MKTILAATAFSLLAVATVRPQQQLDVTVRDGNRLKPGATELETQQWMQSRAIEYAFAEALKPQTQSAGLSPEQIQSIKFIVVRAEVLDQLVKTHPELKGEADALHVQYDSEFSQALLKAQARLKAQSGGR
jgi:hypothetical protein